MLLCYTILQPKIKQWWSSYNSVALFSMNKSVVEKGHCCSNIAQSLWVGKRKWAFWFTELIRIWVKENGSVNASIITHNDKMYCRKRSKNFWTLQYVLQYSAILKMGAKKPSKEVESDYVGTWFQVWDRRLQGKGSNNLHWTRYRSLCVWVLRQVQFVVTCRLLDTES